MKDLIYIPSRLAKHLLADIAPWEHVESIVSLLSIAEYREPFERHNHISKYAIRSKDVKNRFSQTTPFQQYGFSIGNGICPYIGNFSVTQDKTAIYSFHVHDLCNPKYYSTRHQIIDPFQTFPVNLWKIPRHILIRWRYSCKMPIHKSSLLSKKRFEDVYPTITHFDEAIQQFNTFTKMFFGILCNCDESSISYSFVCFVYFFIHDKFLDCLRSSCVDERTFDMLSKALAIVKKIVFIENDPLLSIDYLAAYLKDVVPPSVYGSPPFCYFSKA